MGGVSGKNRPRMFQVCVKIKKHKWNEPANLEKLSLSKAFREHKSIHIGKYSSVQFQFIIYNAVIVQSLFKSVKLKPLNQMKLDPVPWLNSCPGNFMTYGLSTR